jgi:hypothetical protein
MKRIRIVITILSLVAVAVALSFLPSRELPRKAAPESHSWMPIDITNHARKSTSLANEGNLVWQVKQLRRELAVHDSVTNTFICTWLDAKITPKQKARAKAMSHGTEMLGQTGGKP